MPTSGVRISSLQLGELADVIGSDSAGNSRREVSAGFVRRILGLSNVLNTSGAAAAAPKEYLALAADGSVVRVSLTILSDWLSNLLTGGTTSFAALVQLAKDWANKTGGAVEGSDYSSKQWALDSGLARDDADAAADLAQQAAALSELLAGAPLGAEVLPGLESCLSYATRVSQMATESTLVTPKIILDADFVTSKYRLQVGDLGRLLVFKQTSATTSPKLELPYGLLTSGDKYAPLAVINKGAGNVEIINVAATVTSPLLLGTNTEALRNGRNTSTTRTAVPSLTWSRTASWTNRSNLKLYLAIHAIFGAAGAHTCTCTVTHDMAGRPAATVNVLATNSYVGGNSGIFIKAFEIDMGAAAFTGNITVSVQFSDTTINGFEGTLYTVEGAGTATAEIFSAPNAQFIDCAVDTTGPNQLVLLSGTQQGVNNITPVTLSPMTVSLSGNTQTVASSIAPLVNLGYATGSAITPADQVGTVIVTYRAQFNGPLAPMSGIAFVVSPVGGGSGVDTVIDCHTASPYLLEPKRQANIFVEPDGKTYDLSIGA